MEIAEFKIEKGKVTGYIEKEGYYVARVCCQNCGYNYGGIYIPKGTIKELYMDAMKCDVCECSLNQNCMSYSKERR